MSDTATVFMAAAIPTVAALVGLVWNRIEFSELRAELREIKLDIRNARERLVRIETGLGITVPEKNGTKG